MWDDKKFYDALFFAINAHKNQKMMYPKDMPYSAHIFGVCASAVNYCVNEKNIDWDLLVQVALLHDCIEDTSVTYEDIKSKFGVAVADGVLALSKSKNLAKDAIKDSVLRIKQQPREIAIVKMADRLFNIRDRVPVWNKEKQEYYLEDAKFILDNLSYASKTLSEALSLAIENY